MTPAIKDSPGIIIDVPGVEELESYNQRKLDRLIEGEIPTKDFLEAVLGKKLATIHALSRESSTGLTSYSHTSYEQSESHSRDDPYVSPVSPLFSGSYGAFNMHQGLTLSPEVIWCAILFEIGRYVAANVDECASIFNGDPNEKATLRVEHVPEPSESDGGWGYTIGQFRSQLEEHIDGVDQFIPDFSTLNDESRVALLGTFMSAASSYYKYESYTLCGIPQVELTGTAEDWALVSSSAKAIAPKFRGLQGYFGDLLPVLDTIGETAETGKVDEKFWRSIYNFDSMSGGAYVTGWLTALVAYVPDENGQPKLREKFDWHNEFGEPWSGISSGDLPTHVAAVPVTWEDHRDGKTHDLTLTAGVLGCDYNQAEERLVPSLGWGLVETSEE